MLTRFLNGKDFHDRPLASFASTPLPGEVQTDSTSSAIRTSNTQKEFKMTNELQQSAYKSEGTFMTGISGVSHMNAMAIGLAVLVVSMAFGLGFLVARKTAQVVSIPALDERKPLKVGDYGSVF
jgi:hypothetical protein